VLSGDSNNCRSAISLKREQIHELTTDR